MYDLRQRGADSEVLSSGGSSDGGGSGSSGDKKCLLSISEWRRRPWKSLPSMDGICHRW